MVRGVGVAGVCGKLVEFTTYCGGVRRRYGKLFEFTTSSDYVVNLNLGLLAAVRLRQISRAGENGF